MNFLEFIFGLLCLISVDVTIGILLYMLINKNNGTSNNFWSDE